MVNVCIATRKDDTELRDKFRAPWILSDGMTRQKWMNLWIKLYTAACSKLKVLVLKVDRKENYMEKIRSNSLGMDAVFDRKISEYVSPGNMAYALYSCNRNDSWIHPGLYYWNHSGYEDKQW